MFVNFSNHPSSLWSENQRKEAEKYGEIVDLKFPSVNPDDSRDNLIRLAECYIQQILKFKPQCVMCQGEMGLVYHVVRKLKEEDVKVVAACSHRMVEETIDAVSYTHLKKINRILDRIPAQADYVLREYVNDIQTPCIKAVRHCGKNDDYDRAA